MLSPVTLLLAGVVTFVDLIYAISFVAVLSFGLFVTFLAVAHSSSRSSGSPVLWSLAALPGAIVGAIVANHLFWRSFGPTPALVWHLSGIFIGGLATLLLAFFIQRIIVRRRNSDGT